MPNPNTEPSALEQNYPTTQPNRSYNDFTQLEQQIANSEDGSNYAELRARIEALEAALGIVRPDLDQALVDIDELEDNKVDKVAGKELMPSILPGTVESQGTRIEGIETNLANKVDKITGYGLMPNEFNQKVPQLETDVVNLESTKQDKMQFTELPNPYTYLGKIVQYIGPTNQLYTNGQFYQGSYDAHTLQYIWQPVSISKGTEYEPGQGIEITDNVIKCTLLNDTLTSTTTTWSSQKLRAEFEAIAGATKVYIVEELPAIGEINAIYYQGTEAPFNIYLYASTNEWVLIGTTGVNLQNYYNKTETDALLLANKPLSGAGTIASAAPGGTGIRINVLCDNPLNVNNANQHLQLNYNKGLGIDGSNNLEVIPASPLRIDADNKVSLSYGWGLEVTSDTLHAKTVDPISRSANGILLKKDSTLDVDTDGNLTVPLKTINNESLHGSGNISIGSAAQPRELTITQVNANITSINYTYNTIEYPTFYINLLTLTFNGMDFAANTNIQVCNLRGIVGSAYGPDVWLAPIKVANRGYLGTANQIVSASGVNVFLLCNNALSNDTARINVSFITLKS